MRRPGSLESLLRILRRRGTLLGIAESIGAGAAILSGLAVILGLLMLIPGWGGWSALPWLFYIGAPLSVLVGVVAGWMRRPDPLRLAIRVDRHDQLNELLSTAWTLEGSDPLAQRIRAQADEAAANISPRSIHLRRFGARRWGLIVLSVLLAMTVGALNHTLPKIPRTTDALAQQRDRESATLPPPVAGRIGAVAPKGVSPDPAGADAPPMTDAQRPRREMALRLGVSPGTALPGAGGTQARTDDPGAPAPRLAHGTDARQSVGDQASAGAGQGEPGATSTGPSGSVVGAAAAAAPGSRADADWTIKRDEALHRLGTGEVPSAYRDLVRDYFTDEALD